MDMNLEQLISALRSTGSRSKRELLDKAADTIEALAADMRLAGIKDICDVCRNDGHVCEQEMFDCDQCPEPCCCKNCGTDAECWEWRGVQERRDEPMNK